MNTSFLLNTIFRSPLIIPLAAACYFAVKALRVSRRNALRAFAIGVLLAIFMPAPSKELAHTYPKYMFTLRELPFSDLTKQGFFWTRFNYIDPDIAVDDTHFHKWRRFRFGYPIRAVTIDTSLEGHGTAGVIEIDYVILNLVCSFILISLFFFPFRRLYKKLKAFKGKHATEPH